MQTGSRRDPAFTGWPRGPLVVVVRRSYGSGGGMKLMQACSGSLVRDRLSGIAGHVGSFEFGAAGRGQVRVRRSGWARRVRVRVRRSGQTRSDSGSSSAVRLGVVGFAGEARSFRVRAVRQARLDLPVRRASFGLPAMQARSTLRQAIRERRSCGSFGAQAGLVRDRLSGIAVHAARSVVRVASFGVAGHAGSFGVQAGWWSTPCFAWVGRRSKRTSSSTGPRRSIRTSFG